MRSATGSTVIAGGRLFDGTGRAVIADGVVVIDDGRVAYAGPAAGAPRRPEATALSLAGSALLSLPPLVPLVASFPRD